MHMKKYNRRLCCVRSWIMPQCSRQMFIVVLMNTVNFAPFLLISVIGALMLQHQSSAILFLSTSTQHPSVENNSDLFHCLRVYCACLLTYLVIAQYIYIYIYISTQQQCYFVYNVYSHVCSDKECFFLCCCCWQYFELKQRYAWNINTAQSHAVVNIKILFCIVKFVMICIVVIN